MLGEDFFKKNYSKNTFCNFSLKAHFIRKFALEYTPCKTQITGFFSLYCIFINTLKFLIKYPEATYQEKNEEFNNILKFPDKI